MPESAGAPIVAHEASTADAGPHPTGHMPSKRVALVVGATGLVGTELCRQLIRDEHFDTVMVFSRKPLGMRHRRLQVEVIDFARLDEWVPDFAIDTVFCALGTTIAKAGSEEAFRAVDHGLVLSVARLAKRAGSDHFIFVSSAGARPNAPSFYLRVKGEAEEDIRALTLPHAVALRPSVLDGDRQEERPGEQFALRIARLLKPLLIGPLAQFRPTPASLVATAMRDLAQPGRQGFEVIDPVSIGQWRDRIKLSR
ncbi:MAG: NAD-dependent epimerase/dehydratase family protein [Lautropia sp.]|nr:NAD-dependent epimerase/dehydratase family protein [Lautropia sp.]